LAQFILHRIESCDMVFLSSEAPAQEILDYYLSLVPPSHRASVRSRLRIVTVPDRTMRPIAAKLLDRPDLLETIRGVIADRPVFIEPWNVAKAEVDLATELQAPINGTAPTLWHLGYKSTGRRLFAAAGVPKPVGREDIRTVDDVVAAIDCVRAERPSASAVVIKHDDSGAGDGNVVIELRDVRLGRSAGDSVRATLQTLPAWYLRDLQFGGVVEERIMGTAFTSPSAQADITPDGEVVVVSTHEQDLGGDASQVYMGCRFPAAPAYAASLGRYVHAIGEQLARQGAIGRFSVDFAAARDETGKWDIYALEINLRKGGTTHPFVALRNLVPGRYDAESGRWLADDGSTRSYRSTDNLVRDSWLGLPPATVIKALADRDLHFDHRTGTGVVLHMLSCLAIDGRFGLTAIGRTPSHASDLYEAARSTVESSA
jgi:hypothetical protein